jgi:sialidase-1
VGPDGALLHAAFADGTWGPTESLGGTLAAAPGATSWAPNEIEVFAVFPDGQLYNRYWDGTSWHGWEPMGGELEPTAGAAASSWSADRIDVWAVGRDGRIWHRVWDGARWVDWEQLEAD